MDLCDYCEKPATSVYITTRLVERYGIDRKGLVAEVIETIHEEFDSEDREYTCNEHTLTA